MKRFTIHEFPQRSCDFPHKSFAGDYREFIQRNPSEEDVAVFINSHTVDFLRRVIAVVPALLEIYLREVNTSRSKTIMWRTFSFHLEELREQSRPVLAVDNTKRNLS